MLETKFTFLRQLMRKNLRLNRKRTIVTIIGIALSSALIVCVASMITSVHRTAIETTIASTGNHHARVSTPKYFNDLKSRRDLTNFYQTSVIGYDDLNKSGDSKHHNYVKIIGLDNFAASGIRLQSGRFPTASNEILVTERLIRGADRDFPIGSTVTFNHGKLELARPDQTDGADAFSDRRFIPGSDSVTYTIVGKLIMTPFSIGGYDSESSALLTYLSTADQSILPAGTEQTLYYRFKHRIPTASEHESELRRHFKDISVLPNFELASLEGGMLDSTTMKVIITIGAVIIAIIVITSIIVIRNSFSISLTEKTKQFGILKSLGATNRQIRLSVIYESMLMGVVGTILGLGLGILAAAILIWVTNYLLIDSIQATFIDDSSKMVFGLSWIGLLTAIAISLGTVLLSALVIAHRAKKLTAIAAIRGQKDLVVRAKDVKTSRFIQRFFSIGGVIAYKNLRRSRKKYRTTIASLVISVAAFVGVASIVDIVAFSANNSIRHTNFNIVGNYIGQDIATDQNPRASAQRIFDQSTAISEQLSSGDQYTLSTDRRITVPSSYFHPELLKIFSSRPYRGESNTVPVNYTVIDDASFDRTLRENRLPADTTAFTFKEVVIRDSSKKRHVLPIFTSGNIKYHLDSADIYPEYKLSTTETALNLQFVTKSPIGFDNHIEHSVRIFVPRRALDRRILLTNFSIFISAKDDITTIKKINYHLGQNGKNQWQVVNLSDVVRIMNNLIVLIQIFGYGFILVITLIGLTNVFNTITTNMMLRRSDFASLQSIGMTERDLRHMVSLETVLYGLKSLLIGLPLGIGISIGVHRALSGSIDFDYRFPAVAVVISSLALFIVVRIIMQYSVRKIRHQNIIEVIRGENI